MSASLQPTLAAALLALVPGARVSATRVTVEHHYTQLDVQSIDSWSGGVDGLACRIAEHLRTTPAAPEKGTTADAAAAVDDLSMDVEKALQLREVGPLTALQDAADLLRRMAGAIEPRAVLTYRASHDVIELGRYTTAEEAQRHCEAFASREYPNTTVTFDWLADEEDGELAVAELVVQIADGDEVETGYTVTPLEVATAYDPDADE